MVKSKRLVYEFKTYEFRSKGDFSYSVTEEDDGTCNVLLTLYWSGTHTISLLVYEMDIKMSPITVQVLPDPTEKDRYIRSVLEEGLAKKIAQWGTGKPTAAFEKTDFFQENLFIRC